MSGLDAWRGFRYQSLTLVRRLLDDLERSRAAQLEGAAPSGTARYRLERSLDEQGPDWDVIEYRDGRVILDECKSGETLTPDDRRALWQRVRRTVEANPHAEISVRLTVSESTANRDHWVGWDADLRSSAPAAGVLPDRVTTREAAFAEARYWLTTTEERIDVERLLTTFTVAVLPARAQLEASIIATLSGLSGADLATVLARWMEGLTTAVATDGTRDLDAASFVAELGLASRLFQIEPAVLDAWTLMRGGAVAAASSMHVGPLLERSWRDIQPDVAARLDECASSRALLLVGHGGLGKTTLLEQLAREHGGDDVVVWIDDTMPDRHLASAVLLGGWLAEHRRARLLVLVDQLDEMDRASRDARLEAASSAVRASPRATVIATARDATATLVPGNWERVALGDWPVELVRRIVAQSIPEQLCELLRTPLLLALWLDLRATASDAIAVADRASVIGEWLARRLLPSADVRSAGRLSVLTDCAAQALAGRHTWELHGADMGSVRELLDLGMLRGEAGRYRFRHTLLRDAAIVLVWGRDGVDGLVGRLSLGDLSYAVMFDGLRSAFDAAFSPVGMRPVGVTFSWQELLSASRSARLPTTAVIAQAAVPDASAVDVLESVPLDELLDEASEARDTAWVRRLVSMPVKPRPSFIRRASAGSQLLPLYKWCGHHEPDVELSREVARRIRGWLRPGDRGLLPNTWQLPRGVAEMLPDAETVRWLQALDGKPSLFTFEFRKLASASSELPLDARRCVPVIPRSRRS